MITIDWAYILAGSMFAAFSLLGVLDRSNPKRWGNAAFWGLMAVSLLAGSRLGDFVNGLLVLGLTGLAGSGAIGRSHPPTTDPATRASWSHRLGNRLFLPALIIPATALLGTLLYSYSPVGSWGWIEPRRETYIFLCLGAVIALLVLHLWLRPPPLAALQEGRRLIDSIGWAAVLPQLLAALGVLFAAAGIGELIGEAARSIIPQGSIFLTVLVYGLGMALFTMVMGNAFAAFPVMAAAIGIPLLIRTYGGDAAVIGAIGMLAGFCGTLMTPMAANFNIVPAGLLELRDRHGVIKAQVATAIPLLAINLLLIYYLAW